MKKLAKILVIVLVILVLVVLTGLFYVDSLTRQGIEAGATYATGVETTLGNADVGITTGELTMGDLNVASPEGFDSDHFLTMRYGHVAVGLASLMQDKIEIPVIELRDINLIVERANGKNNFDVILASLQQLSSGEATTEEGKGFVIRELTLENISVTVKGFGVPSKPIALPPIKLTNIGEGGEAAQLSKVVGIVIRELLSSLLSDPSQLPDVLVAGLGKGLEGLGDLGKVGVEALENVGEEVGKQIDKAAEQIGGEAGEAVKGLGEDVDKGLKNTAKGLGGLFDKKEKDDDKSNE